MDSFELNKIMGAVLGTLLFVMGVGFLAEAVYHPIENRGPGYTLPEPEAVDQGGEAEVVAVSIGTLLASANAGEGEDQTRKCMSCHTLNQGGANGQGPNLWDIVERPVASHEGFAYSPEMVAHAQVAPLWTYEELDAFLLAPRSHIPGTKMNFGGVKNDSERANIIAFLSTLSADPKPFPAADDAAPAEGEAAEADAAPAEEAAPVEEASPAEEAAPVEQAPAEEAPAAAEPAATEEPAAAEEPAATEQMPAPTDATSPSTETMTAPEPATDSTPASEPAATVPVETPTTTQTETVVEGTPTAPGATAEPAAQ